SLLPLTKSFVKAEGENQAEWMEAARERWQNYFYILSISESSSLIVQDRVERELTNILAVIDSFFLALRNQRVNEDEMIINCSSMEQGKKFSKFIVTIIKICRIRGYWSDCERMCHMGIKVSRAINDTQSVGWRHYDLSKISFYKGDLSTS